MSAYITICAPGAAWKIQTPVITEPNITAQFKKVSFSKTAGNSLHECP